MKDVLRRISHIPLLTPAKGGAFERGIVAARAENGIPHTKHILQERIVYSLLAYRARMQLGASIREISRLTGLHPKTVATTLNNLSDLAHEHDGRWFANEPTDGWFVTMPAANVEHWSQRFGYVWLLLPRRGAKFQVGDQSRRFSLNHAVVFSFLRSFADKKTGIVQNQSVLGLSKMLHGLNRKTITSVLDDLCHLGLAEKHPGQPLVTKLPPMKEEHFALFAPPSKLPEAEPEPDPASARPESNTYVFKEDGFDEHRRLCQSFFSQSYAERVIRAVRILDWDYHKLQLELENWKLRSEENVRTGKCKVENFGKFFATPLVERAKAIEEEDRREEAQRRYLEYLDSPKGKKAEAERQAAIAADPLHEEHLVNVDSVLDRVQFSSEMLKNRSKADCFMRKVNEHVNGAVWRMELPTHQKSDVSTMLYRKLVALALAEINEYYKEVRATPKQLEAAIV